MNKKVLIVSFSFEQEAEAFALLKAQGVEPLLLAEQDRKGFGQTELLEYWNKLDEKPTGILMGADISLGSEFAKGAAGLKFISLNCAGSDHLDIAAFKEQGIVVCNVPRQNFDAVADLAWGLILSTMRRIVKGNETIRQGHWCDGVARGSAVSKKTIGIIGFGAIGQGVAKRATGFDMEILVNDVVEDSLAAAKYQAKFVDRETIFRRADIIIPTCPLVPDTYHLLNEAAFAKMKQDAFVINAARGGIIDTAALINALKDGQIAGAGLDVYEEEPLYDSELFSFENVVLTPHMGGLADREIHNVAMGAAQHMISLLQGKETGTELTKGE
jgi:D-3-phosphoglycerate dehydrogenase